jgi:AhpD family alkylhydroperoxidase
MGPARSQPEAFAHLAVAAMVGCSWCLDFGYFHAHNEGLDDAKASQVPRWRHVGARRPRMPVSTTEQQEALNRFLAAVRHGISKVCSTSLPRTSSS